MTKAEYEHNINDLADLILEYLHQLGVEYVFGVPGGAIEPLYNALARSERRGGIKAITARHECGAAFMADGYYRETGKLGVVCSTTGPGATNLITGVANAYVDKIPMLVITAQTALPKFGKRALQDSSETAIDTVGIFRHVTRFNSFVSHAEQFEGKLISAIMSSFQQSGPAHISVPSDIFQTDYGHSDPNVHITNMMKNISLEDAPSVEALCKELAAAKNVAIFLGHNCGRAYQEIAEFAHMINAPYVAAPTGKRWVDESDDLYAGVYGYAGHESARQLFQDNDFDLILAVGTSLGEMSIGMWESQILNEKLIHIDESIESFARSPMAKLHVFGHLDAIFNSLIESVKDAKYWGRGWNEGLIFNQQEKNSLGSYFSLVNEQACYSDDIPVKPQRLMACLNDKLPEYTRIYVDTGNAWAWCTHYMVTKSKRGQYRIAMGYGTMAWAIGSAIGGAFAQKQQLDGKLNLKVVPHVCITGDGSYLMSAQEISVAAEHNLPVVFIILNDAAFGMIRHGQQLAGAESIGWQLNNVNYAALARSMGVDGIEITDPKQLDELDFDTILTKCGPTLIDVRIDPDEVPPMASRVKTLAGESEGEIEVKTTGYK
ncbi:thiamine pyrophosphate-binding protein [Catenovulum sp. SM1970]|uniref:thiamine pyrophosphate-binding protein n=1 Tax=Marinifaba aquimaris TaxID=2741323 RepID=UPI001572E873|nr:thiamine pyrophosphate-binding protein [Marinifaba aquimaris]NTS76645.1 thiamine pyrophosphate-binding protein [Marinifaba aquimaris]